MSSSRKISIELEDSELTGEELVDKLIKPLMLAIGYHPDTINEALGLGDTNEKE